MVSVFILKLFVMYHFKPIILIAILFLVFVFSKSISAQTNEIKLRHISSIQLDKEYAYEKLIASEEFLVWFEHYTFSLNTYNLITGKRDQIQLKKGRGPGEVTWLNSYAILDKVLVLYDFGAMKLVYFDLVTGNYLREQVSNMMIQNVFSDGKSLYGSGLSPNGFFFKFDPVTKIFQPMSNSKMPFLNSYNMADPSFNPFRIQGSFAFSKNSILFNNYYEPVMFVYNFESQNLDKYKYEDIPEVDFESGRVGNTLGAPKPLRMYIDKISALSTHSIAVLARGKSNSRDYLSKIVHVFDIESRKHTNQISFDYEVNDISTTETLFITLSKETYKISIYEY